MFSPRNRAGALLPHRSLTLAVLMAAVAADAGGRRGAIVWDSVHAAQEASREGDTDEDGIE